MGGVEVLVAFLSTLYRYTKESVDDTYDKCSFCTKLVFRQYNLVLCESVL